MTIYIVINFFFQAEDGIRDPEMSRGLGDVYKRQVMDVNDGRILSLVTFPSYDPNKFWQYNSELFRGWYSQDLFEPGSTFKPINLALALEEKIIQKDGFVEDIGKINVGGWTLSNWDKKGNGYIDYPKVLQVSSCLLYTSPSPRDISGSRMPSSA